MHERLPVPQFFAEALNLMHALKIQAPVDEPPRPLLPTKARILIVSDTWRPQTNGVVRTLSTLKNELRQMGHHVKMVTPNLFASVPFPPYPEIKIALWPFLDFERRMRRFKPHAVHIATEGSLGQVARYYCTRNNIPFTTSFHTRFPEYLEAHCRIPAAVTMNYLRWFHSPAKTTMVSTPSFRADLASKGFSKLGIWARGVDSSVFNPDAGPRLPYPRPIHLYVGRVAHEKNIEAFLSLDLPGTKLVVGDGPQLELLKAQYADVVFTGAKYGRELAAMYAGSDVFVFPSKTDTFGLVLLEALASGLPVAAYPVTGPIDIIAGSGAGVLSEDLKVAIQGALEIPREHCLAHALQYSWRAASLQFLGNLAPIDPAIPAVNNR